MRTVQLSLLLLPLTFRTRAHPHIVTAPILSRTPTFYYLAHVEPAMHSAANTHLLMWQGVKDFYWNLLVMAGGCHGTNFEMLIDAVSTGNKSISEARSHKVSLCVAVDAEVP